MQRRNVFAVLNGIDGSLIIYLLGNGLSRHIKTLSDRKMPFISNT